MGEEGPGASGEDVTTRPGRLPEDFGALVQRRKRFMTPRGTYYATVRPRGIWLDPGSCLIPYEEFAEVARSIGQGTFKPGDDLRTHVVTAILAAVLPGFDKALEMMAAATAAAIAKERARLADERRAAEAEARRRSEEAKQRSEEAARRESERRRAEAAELARTKASFLAHLRAKLASDFLGIDRVWANDPRCHVVPISELEALKGDVAQRWANRTLPESLDGDQAAAIAATSGDVRVVARAGSGKTRTIVARAAFLQRHCGVAPGEQLLLAFNRKAATEMKERLVPLLGSKLPHVMTFHALAYALIHPDEDVVFDDPRSGGEGLSREVQDVIDEHIRSEEFGGVIRDVMLAHFRGDWERIEDAGTAMPIAEFLEYRRSLPRQTLAGEYVKSFGERLIANVLFENDVRYAYERSHPWHGVNYRPDFTIPAAGGGVAIEYFGLKGDPDYDEMSERKRVYWRTKEGWALLAYVPQDIAELGADGFRTRLLADLARMVVPTRKRSEEEIWQEVRQRAVDNFSKTMTGFIARCRKLDLTPDGLRALILSHDALPLEARFLSVAESVYAGYLHRLRARGLEDFDGLMWRATRSVQSGSTEFLRNRAQERGDLASLRFVQVDEFQDFSDQFHQLLSGIRQVAPGAQFFFVGDDWQAINGFAGADLRYFNEFHSLFRDTTSRAITTNYRSAPAVVRAGNALMTGLGAPAKPHHSRSDGTPVRVARFGDFTPTERERELHDGDDLTPVVLRLARHFLDRGQTVVLLSRRNSVSGFVNYTAAERRAADGLERFLGHVRSFLPDEDRERVTISTTHRYKGLEQDAVVILDALVGSYPLVHPSLIFTRLFGDGIDKVMADERRLFYVALTRARRSLVILTDRARPSPFIEEIKQREPILELDWGEFPAVGGLGEARVTVRVHGAFNAHDRIKGLGYHWNKQGEYWARTFEASGFDPGTLTAQDWVAQVARIDVLSESGQLLLQHRSSGTPGRAFALGNDATNLDF